MARNALTPSRARPNNGQGDVSNFARTSSHRRPMLDCNGLVLRLRGAAPDVTARQARTFNETSVLRDRRQRPASVESCSKLLTSAKPHPLSIGDP